MSREGWKAKRTTENISTIAIAKRKIEANLRRELGKTIRVKKTTQRNRDLEFFNDRYLVAISILNQIPKAFVKAKAEELKLKRLIKEMKK